MVGSEASLDVGDLELFEKTRQGSEEHRGRVSLHDDDVRFQRPNGRPQSAQAGGRDVVQVLIGTHDLEVGIDLHVEARQGAGQQLVVLARRDHAHLH